jgi:catechol 2,3-dioxygenase-like lactoylglutathione lyase family enzyme
MDQKLEVVIIPVADVDRSKAFYQGIGWRLDVTPPFVVQLTPPGSWCSVQFAQGATLTPAAPGSARCYLVVADIVAARDALVTGGAEVSDYTHLGASGIEPGLDPDRGTYRSRATFADPDGNTWILQEITTRLPGRVDPALTGYGSVEDLAGAMRRASAAHGEHEKRIGEADPNWPDWYAAYMIAEQAGTDLPS